MTVPHLMNCPHTDAGWCTECVAELGNENWRLRDRVLELESVHEDASGAVLQERERLLPLTRCGCGDHFTAHDPGTCGACVAALTCRPG